MFARDRCLRDLERVARALEDEHVTVKAALEYAFTLGEECAREDAMHRACLGFSEVRAHREALMKSFVTTAPASPRI